MFEEMIQNLRTIPEMGELAQNLLFFMLETSLMKEDLFNDPNNILR